VTTFETEPSDQLSLPRFQTLLLSLFPLVAQEASVKPSRGKKRILRLRMVGSSNCKPLHTWLHCKLAAIHLSYLKHEV